MFDVVIIGAGPAGMNAAQQAGKLGARTALVSKGYVGGMATTDGPVPVRTLAHAARLVREAQQLQQYGIASTPPFVDYPKLLDRVREVVVEVYEKVSLLEELQALNVAVYENVGAAQFVDPYTIAAGGLTIQGEKIIICAGGHSRPLPVPGFDFTITHSDAWSLRATGHYSHPAGGDDSFDARFVLRSSRMTFLQHFTGVLFIISGLVKAVDPMGTAFKMEQYFSPTGAVDKRLEEAIATL